MTFGELFDAKEYNPTARGDCSVHHVEAPVEARVELIDPLYQYLDLQTLIEKASARFAKSHATQSVRFRAADFPFCVEHRVCEPAADSSELSLPLEFKNRVLGTLTLSHGRRFSIRESKALSSEAQVLGGPCHNALLYAQACYSACHDELTGLFNRAVLKSPLLSPLAHTTPADLVLLVCDIDHFKLINDNHGHAAGDAVLRHFAAKLQSIISDDDIVVRYGGDEFVIAVPNCHAGNGIEFVENLRRSIESCRIEVQGETIDITTTIGVTARRPEEPIENTILRADTALLEGKKAGRNRVVWL